MLKWFFRFVAFLFLLGAGAAVAAAIYIDRLSDELPNPQQLANYEPPIVTRLYAGDSHLLMEYAREKRVFVPIEAIPQRVVDAFLSAEDQNFYSHPGVDFVSLVRALATNVMLVLENKRPQGASTITQQVARNFLLSNELSINRKIKEALLAFRIEQIYSKQQILELYLNEIYLGYNAYGVAAAALNYFDKSLDELSVAEAAYLAALPKAPANYDPFTRRQAAVGRRNWVIGRMLEDQRVTAEEARAAREEPLEVRGSRSIETATAEYFAEDVRREIAARYGDASLYEGGLVVRTTVDPTLQEIAEKALRDGLIAYDRRHGWRGALTELDLAASDWRDRLASIMPPPGSSGWQVAVVTGLRKDAAEIALAGGGEGRIPMTELAWARQPLEEGRVGPEPKKPEAVLAPGQVVLVERVEADASGKAYPEGTFGLRQEPEIDGALVALDPHSGRVLAMSGGYAFARSEYNRASQAERQPGSAFKPFVYMAALDAGYSPNSIIIDAPYVVDLGGDRGKWKPENYSEKFYGPTTMRIGLEQSRNLMTIRLAEAIGMGRVMATAGRFEIFTRPIEPDLSVAIGSGVTTLLKLTAAYGMIGNGGKLVAPTLIDRIQDRHGRTIYRRDQRACPGCRLESYDGRLPPELPDERPQVQNPVTAYQMVAMLEGVVQRGTASAVSELGRPLAGKTGTTDDYRDAWFVGFSPDLVAGVYVGFDQPKPLGPGEAATKVAVPIWKDFMAEALKGKPARPFPVPPGIRLVRVEHATGQPPARGNGGRVILEAFRANESIEHPRGWSVEQQAAPTPVPAGTTGGTAGGLY